MLPSRGKLPDIGGHRQMRESVSLPPENSPEDPFMQGHSKLYHRRREIEAELRRDFNLPEEGVASPDRRRDIALKFGRPPPVPKLRRDQFLPQIPPRPQQAQSEPPSRHRWGNIEEPAVISPQRPRAEKEDQWWRQEQQNLHQPSASSAASAAWPAQEHPPPAPTGSPLPRAERIVKDRPNSWRQKQAQMSAEAQAAAQLGPAASGAHSPALPSAAPSPDVHKVQQKARDLEDLAREFKQKREARENRIAATADPQVNIAEQQHAEANEHERQRRLAEEKAQQARQREEDEEQRFEKLRERELKKQQREVEDAEHRRREQEEWESDIRKRFKEEEKTRKQQSQQDMVSEADRQAHAKAEVERRQAQRDGDAERRERHARVRDRAREREALRQERQEEARRCLDEEARSFEAEKLRAAEAERFKRPPMGAPPARGRAASRADVAGGAASSGVSRERSFGAAPSAPSVPSPPSVPSLQRRSASTPAAPAASSSLPADEALRQAELAAMQQLRGLELLPTKEEKQRAFKELLRAWHPDKNPQNVELATAVFQRLNSERKKVLT